MRRPVRSPVDGHRGCRSGSADTTGIARTAAQDQARRSAGCNSTGATLKLHNEGRMAGQHVAMSSGKGVADGSKPKAHLTRTNGGVVGRTRKSHELRRDGKEKGTHAADPSRGADAGSERRCEAPDARQRRGAGGPRRRRALRCSSNRRSRRCSWSPSACRAGTRWHRRCPSASGCAGARTSS